MYFNQSDKPLRDEDYQDTYLNTLRNELLYLESIGKKGSPEWWVIAKDITAIENDL